MFVLFTRLTICVEYVKVILKLTERPRVRFLRTFARFKNFNYLMLLSCSYSERYNGLNYAFEIMSPYDYSLCGMCKKHIGGCLFPVPINVTPVQNHVRVKSKKYLTFTKGVSVFQ